MALWKYMENALKSGPLFVRIWLLSSCQPNLLFIMLGDLNEIDPLANVNAILMVLWWVPLSCFPILIPFSLFL